MENIGNSSGFLIRGLNNQYESHEGLISTVGALIIASDSETCYQLT